MDGVKTHAQVQRQRAPSLSVSDANLNQNKETLSVHYSCLDIIVSLINEVQATKMLDITPIKQLVKDYWAAYQLVYGFFMISHIIFMAFYTKFGLHTIICHHSPNISSLREYYTEVEPHIFPSILLLIWRLRSTILPPTEEDTKE